MNLRIIYITIGILSTRLLAAQNQTMELTLEQVVNMARLGISRCTDCPSQFPVFLLEL